MKRFVLLLLVSLVATLNTGVGAEADQRALVQPIEESKLDEMLSAKDNRLAVKFYCFELGYLDHIPILTRRMIITYDTVIN